MSRGEHAHFGHAATNGDVAKYLEAENPNAPVNELADRFKIWKRTGELPPIRANFKCPDCGGHLFYTQEIRITRCENCELNVYETDRRRGQ